MESLIPFDEGLEVLPTRKVDTHCREPFLDLQAATECFSNACEFRETQDELPRNICDCDLKGAGVSDSEEHYTQDDEILRGCDGSTFKACLG